VLVVEGVSLCRVLGTKTSGAERAGDCHIHRKALPPTPNTDRDVPWPTTRGGPKNVLLLKRVSEHGLLTKPANQVAHAVVSHDDIPVPSAARGVVAENINGLLAHRAGGARRHNRHTEPVGDRDPKVLGLHDGVHSVDVGGDSRHEGPSVGLRDAKKALTLPAGRGAIHKTLVDALIDPEGGVLLGAGPADDRGGDNPLLGGGRTGLPEAGGEGGARVVDDPPKTQPPQRRSETRLSVDLVRHGEAQMASADRMTWSKREACSIQRSRGVVLMKWTARTMEKETRRRYRADCESWNSSSRLTEVVRREKSLPSTKGEAVEAGPRGTPSMQIWSVGTKVTPGMGQEGGVVAFSQDHSHLAALR